MHVKPLALVTLVILLAGCSPAPPDTPDGPALDAPLPPPATGIAWTRDGKPVRGDVISLQPGPEHCDVEEVLFLTLGWPPGRQAKFADEARQFVRDPEGLFPHRLLGSFEWSTALPADAVFTGYLHESDQLWLAPSTWDRVAFVVRTEGVVEQWPRAAELYGCA